MNLLVTGGAGFIGSALIRSLLLPEGKLMGEPPGAVVNLDALTYAGNLANLEPVQSHPLYRFVHGDITDASLLEKVFRDYEITSVLHLAAETHVDRSIDDPARFVKTNVEGTYCLLEAARKVWPRRGSHRFVHVSTDEVFGSLAPDDPPFSESSPHAPNSPYAASKAASDHLARAYFQTYGLPVITTHCSNNYGPGQFPEKLIPLIILRALESRQLPVYGDGQQIRDWLFVDDHVRGLVAALMKGVPGECYAFGSSAELTNLSLVRMICAGLDERLLRAQGSYEDLIAFVEDRPGHDRRYAIDASKARRDLGWQPEENLESALGKTIDWYLTHRPWCDAISRGTYRGDRLGAPK